MGTFTQTLETVGSRWVTLSAATKQYPSDGQGGATATATASICANASASRPAIIEAIKVGTVTTNPVQVSIRNAGDSATLFTYTFPVSTSSAIVNLGVYGVQVDQNWCVIYSGGTPTDVQVFFRF